MNKDLEVFLTSEAARPRKLRKPRKCGYKHLQCCVTLSGGNPDEEPVPTSTSQNNSLKGVSVAPTEEDYVRYFYFLRHVKDYVVSSLWSMYSRLNNGHQRRFGTRLQQWPRITNMLKGYASGYQRKSASIFTREQMEQALQVQDYSLNWVLWKAIVSVAFLGGLRGIELRSITYGNVNIDNQGVWVDYSQAKRKGEEKMNGFLIPFNREEPHLCFATRVTNYRDKLLESVPEIKPQDAFFRRVLKKRFSNKEVIGRTAFGRIGREIATKLNLSNPEGFTGHCFRRSAATEAANNGATTTDLKTGMGWENERTALQYIERTKNQKRRMSTLLTGRTLCDPSPPPEKVSFTNQSPPKEKFTAKNESEMTVCKDRASIEGQKVYKIDLHGAQNITVNFH